MIDMVPEILAALERNEVVALATVIRSSATAQVQPGMKLLVKVDGTAGGSLAGSRLEGPVRADCQKLMQGNGEENRCVRYDLEEAAQDGVAEVYIEVLRKPATAIIVGAGHIGVHLTKIAKAVGFEVTVIDDRAEFANPERFPEADKVIAADVDETLANLRIDGHTYVVLVTRGHKHDEIALRQVVNSNAAYIGMIGSRARVRTVQERLLRDGFAREKLDRVYAPIGLDIGAVTPEEIALSIAAEMVKVRRGGQGVLMKDRLKGKAVDFVRVGLTTQAPVSNRS